MDPFTPRTRLCRIDFPRRCAFPLFVNSLPLPFAHPFPNFLFASSLIVLLLYSHLNRASAGVIHLVKPHLDRSCRRRKNSPPDGDSKLRMCFLVDADEGEAQRKQNLPSRRNSEKCFGYVTMLSSLQTIYRIPTTRALSAHSGSTRTTSRSFASITSRASRLPTALSCGRRPGKALHHRIAYLICPTLLELTRIFGELACITGYVPHIGTLAHAHGLDRNVRHSALRGERVQVNLEQTWSRGQDPVTF